MAEERKWRALWRVGRGVWEGAGITRGSEGQGAGGSSKTIDGGEEAAVRLWMAVRRWQRQRGSGERGGGGSAVLELGWGVGRNAVLEGGEEAVS